MFNFKQGEDDITTYFSKVQMALDELREIQSLPLSIGAVRTDLETFLDQDNLILFLNGLSGHFDMVRDQILMIDPLLSLSKTFSQLLQIEK